MDSKKIFCLRLIAIFVEILSMDTLQMQPPVSRRHLLALLAAGALPAPASARPAHAQNPSRPFPDRPVRLIIPVAPGGSLDILGRTFARHLTLTLGQPVVAENHPGAGSNLAFELVARARPDGHTLLVGSDPLTINPSIYRRIGFDPVRDFAPIAELVRAPQVLVVHPTHPAGDLAGFLRAARAAEGRMAMASQGNGSIGHLAGAVLARRAEVSFTFW
jgi:tripartite-type tricarboxylate transporter receptor subunit TctC